MVPTEGSCGVTPIKAEKVGITQYVPPKISRKKKCVLFVNPVVCFGVQVVEIKLAVVYRFVVRKFQKKVGIRSSSADHKRTAVLDDRPVNLQPRSNQANPPFGSEVLFIAV